MFIPRPPATGRCCAGGPVSSFRASRSAANARKLSRIFGKFSGTETVMRLGQSGRSSLLAATSLAIIAGPCALSALTTEPVPLRAPDTKAARVLACASCHGSGGQGTADEYIPRLAGKPSGYLLNQLIAFRDGRRKYPPMRHLLEYLPDAYLARMADFYAAQHPELPVPAPNVASAEILARGEMLVRYGDPPARAACHLCQRPAGCLALWHSHSTGTRLHAGNCWPSDGKRC